MITKQKKIIHVLTVFLLALIAVAAFSCSDSVDKVRVTGADAITNATDSGTKPSVVIDASICYGCSYEYCYVRCPTGAVSKTVLENNRRAYIIDPEKCIKCGICIDLCPFDAITWKH